MYRMYVPYMRIRTAVVQLEGEGLGGRTKKGTIEFEKRDQKSYVIVKNKKISLLFMIYMHALRQHIRKAYVPYVRSVHAYTYRSSLIGRGGIGRSHKKRDY
eukprot:TRINITY_DN2268_c0_g5_i1.p3 TRINITY_DN2268_c0_g5~~TRINITY_DN2268_c0_g5_i1.p3  ORF type:complete len:101 (+),score=6.77 TRINITY_DN2268_c0_g5_i1:441-743(+)